MGVFEKFEDALTKGVSGKETIRVPFEQMSKFVCDEFIKGNDDEFLEKVKKTAKGGNMFTEKKLESKNGRYLLQVGGTQRGVLLLGKRKTVWVKDMEANKFYQLDKDRKWKKFYKSVLGEINMERINRNR